MAENNELLKDSTSIVKEIESQLEKLLLSKKEQVEKQLLDRIDQEKKDAKLVLERIEKEFAKEKEFLKDYEAMIAEYEKRKVSLQEQIKEHFNKALYYQKEIEKMAGDTLEELRKVTELNHKLDELRQNAEQRAFFLKRDLEEKFGILAQAPKSKESEEIRVDLSQELEKLKRIKELLGMEGQPEGSEFPGKLEEEINSEKSEHRVPNIHEVMETSHFPE
jgi:hypothetical protein